MSEPVSDKKLELLAEYVRCVGGSPTQKVVTFAGGDVDTLLTLLLELKSRRKAQPAGCAEMAQSINEHILEQLGKCRCGVYVYDMAVAVDVIAAKLAPWCALLGECREFAAEVLQPCINPGACLNDLCKSSVLIASKLDAALGTGDAGETTNGKETE